MGRKTHGAASRRPKAEAHGPATLFHVRNPKR